MNGVEKRAKNERAESSTTHVPLNTSQSAISSHRKVIIIGAGSTGLALAHGLKKKYEEEMVMRAGEEVRLSEESTVKLHNWSSVMQSPLIKNGLGIKIK
ncbi:unnamed protein product [Penicillium viridicatum]